MSDGKRASGPPWESKDIPKVLTYIYPDPEPLEPRYQLQGDYEIEWPKDGRPRIKLVRYRSYQRNADGEKAVLVEDITEEIPVNQLIMMNISKHAAGYLYAYAELDGDWRFVDRTMFEGAKEAAQKRFSLASFRKMAQADPNPDLL
ncbi:MAG: hypothetical protein LC114_03650 [Bryobacterales bacterium]|nr:hypothetical protein [Bryobacterales bacterium]